ncbi:MAG: Smr/MutS family protein, partial [Candidatus Limnocylindrales bacterium]
EEVRAEAASIRRLLERGHVAAPALDAALEGIERTAARLPAASRSDHAPAAAGPRTWQVGERARSASGGWEGRIAALDRDGSRVSLEAGGMRVSVPVDDLTEALTPESGAQGGGPGMWTPSAAGRERAGASTNVDQIRLSRARTVPSSLDLRGARVDEALTALDRYLEDGSLAGLDRVTVIHGLGTGALRDAVRSAASIHPLVKSVRPGERGEGGDGATIVSLG